MSQHKSDDRFEEQVKSALGKSIGDGFQHQVKSALGKTIGDGFQHAGPHPALRDKMMFEAGKAAQGRADRKYLAGSLFLGLAGGWVVAFLPASLAPLAPVDQRSVPNERPFASSGVETGPPVVTEPSNIWRARIDLKKIEEPTVVPDLSGTEFIHAEQPTTVRSISDLLRELQR